MYFNKSKIYTFSLIIILLLTLFVLNCYSQTPYQKAKFILEKTFNKYDALFSEGMKGVNSAIAKMTIKGQGKISQSSASSPPMLINANVEMYAVQPNKMLLGITGNMGNIQIIISGKKPLNAIAILPNAKQFATFPISERNYRGFQPQSRDKFWNEVDLVYDGTQDMKQGKAHKIIMKSKNPKQKETSIAYILDQKWDPIRLEIIDPIGGNTTIDFQEIRINAFIPPDKFVPRTTGYTQVTKEQFTGALIMQMMASEIGNDLLK